MTVVVTPYDLISPPPTTGGTWAFISGPGAPPPFDPDNLTYNCTLEFDDAVHDFGIYVFEYTVELLCDPAQTRSTTVSIYFGDSFPASNDECDAPVSLIFPYTSGGIAQTSLNNQNLVDQCPGLTYSASADPPATWPGTLGSDAWYKVKFVSGGSPVPVYLKVTVTGVAYGLAGINTPLLALYDQTGTDCAGMTLVEANFGASQTVSVVYTGSFAADIDFIIRVGAIIGTEGFFSIILESFA